MRCPYCQQNIRVQGRFCPRCGEQIFGLPVRAPRPEPAGSEAEADAPTVAQPSYPSDLPPPARPPDLGSDTIEIEPERPAAAPIPWSGATTASVHPAAGDEVGKTCPYCRFPVKPSEPVQVCPACKVAHHQDCWRENRGCTTYGCQGATAPATPRLPATPRVGTPRGPVGGPLPDLMQMHSRELEARAGNALWLTMAGMLCCPPLTLLGLFMALGLLAETSRLGRPAGRARRRAIGAIVAAGCAMVLWVVALVVQGRGLS